MAEIVPFPPGGRRPDPVSYLAWEDLMLSAAGGLAESVDYDEQVLAAAVGPEIEVGVNPPWRVLLQIAQLEAAAHNCGLNELGTTAWRVLHGERTPVLAFG
ncbi:MAG: hypothetical protein ACRDQ1_05320 [Sciscionella sp.]